MVPVMQRAGGHQSGINSATASKPGGFEGLGVTEPGAHFDQSPVAPGRERRDLLIEFNAAYLNQAWPRPSTRSLRSRTSCARHRPAGRWQSDASSAARGCCPSPIEQACNPLKNAYGLQGSPCDEGGLQLTTDCRS